MVTHRSRNKLDFKKTLLLLFFTGLLGSPAIGANESPGPESPPLRRNTDIQVDSQKDLKSFSVNEKTKRKEERPVFYSDDSASVGFNDDGDPNVSMRW